MDGARIKLGRREKRIQNFFIWKAEGKRPFGYYRHIHEDNIKICLKQSGKAGPNLPGSV